MEPITFLNRQALHLRPDPTRVIVHPFKLATEPTALHPTDIAGILRIMDRVLSLPPEAAERQITEVLENFRGRHRNLLESFEARAEQIEAAVAPRGGASLTQRRLIGACFMHEYSFEAAALFNPSIVPHPDQSGISRGELRFVLSLRAVGEGHVSSLTFRSGTVSVGGHVTIDPTARLASIPKVTRRISTPEGEEVEVRFVGDADLSERVLFPVTLAQSRGIEDARFVLFDDDGEKTYRATYTAYSGSGIRSELIETDDFRSFKMSPLSGAAARDKGMALFPRRIGGKYAMITREDSESLFLSYSDNLYHWDDGRALLTPRFPWELVKIGNCGSPIELDEGWLLLTHGVGPVRRYSIGAVLLDKQDPSQVIARAQGPLVHPEPSEREGYVPNVVYTCGAMRHDDRIVLPYAVSDTFSKFSTIRIVDLLRAMTPGS